MAKQTEQEAALREVVEADLRAGGVLAQALPGYEERPAQIEMARLVADAMESGQHAVIEAATGTGKSHAYLLPIVRSGKVALLSTANKALQEQLFYKDIPFVQRNVRDFRAALVKGMNNYLCLDRFEKERGALLRTRDDELSQLEAQLDEEKEWDGDLDLLPFALPNELRSHVAAEADECAWRECPFFGDCYVRKMRDRSREAQVIVVNHTLLLLDMAMDGWLLPERDLVVIDEAHHLEDEATRAFTVTVTPGRVLRLLNLSRLQQNAEPRVLQDARAANTDAWDALRRVTGGDQLRGRRHLTQPLEEGLWLAQTIDDLATSLQRRRPEMLDGKEEQLYDKLVKRTRTLAADLRVVFGVKTPTERVYYLEYTGAGPGPRRPPQPSVSAAPLSVAALLKEKLFDTIPTIATSATLAVNGNFQFYRSRVGLPDAREKVLPLTFDYQRRALLYVPRHLPAPTFGAENQAYLAKIANEVRDLVEASRGRAFLLFSSKNALDAVYNRIGERLEDDGYALITQGQGFGRVEMLRQFRALPQAVLFGLKSFWEGVDVAGEALSLVVIDKLPFTPPDDPVHEARVARMREAGENWFGGYALPLAVLQLKQGVGRLLRTSEDRGVMAILDTRLYTKGYGKQVFASLPPAPRTSEIDDVKRFFAETEQEDEAW